jgi:hypothetical protein
MHSTAITRVIGRAVVNIFHRNYRPTPVSQNAGGGAAGGTFALQ